MRFVIPLLLLLTLSFPTANGAEPSCEFEEYFAPDDPLQSEPLAKPHPEFLKLLRLARRGNPVAQNNLAASYHGSYMVTKCMPKAEYWYRLAAAGGNKNAQDWVARYPSREERTSGAAALSPAANSPSEASRPSAAQYSPDSRIQCIAPPSDDGTSTNYQQRLNAYNKCLAARHFESAVGAVGRGLDCLPPAPEDGTNPDYHVRLNEYQKCLMPQRSEQR